jgi:hypothetical protein
MPPYDPLGFVLEAPRLDLLRLFFVHCYPAIPILPMEIFFSNLHVMPRFLTLALCSYGAMFDEMPALSVGKPRYERALPFFEEARRLFNAVMNRPSVLHIYGIFVLQVVSVSMFSPSPVLCMFAFANSTSDSLVCGKCTYFSEFSLNAAGHFY